MTGSYHVDSQPAGSELINDAGADLATLLGPGWEVRREPAPDRQIDGIWTIAGPDGRRVTILVEAKTRLTPSDAERVLVPQVERHLRALLRPATAMVVAPWLSPRTRQVLDSEGVNYLDITGNVSLRVIDPAIVIRTQGDQRDPAPGREVRRGIAGPRAGRVVRQLVDFDPPRRVRELSVASDISESYASRLLDTLEEQALIRRKDRIVQDIDWSNLLRTRAESYELMRVNHVVGAIARRGVDVTLDVIRAGGGPHETLMTGVGAVDHYAPLVVGGALMLYVPPGPRVVDEVMKWLGLLRVSGGGTPTVHLLQPMSHGVFDRPGPLVDGLPTVGPSQLALDCLSGPGRLPAAGEALIEWMKTGRWRQPSPIVDGEAPVR